ncbi:MAG: ABC transporter ATP-binding protein [Candidatus Eisenbacteria bacterium]|nr:ABC transporter ATP-binding protein [Candidatus Eisenbacteria bacterium]
MIEARDLRYRYDEGGDVLEGVGFRIGAGEKVVLLGANSSGKSTLLKILDGLIFPAGGSYSYKGKPVTRSALRRREAARAFRKEVALLFQNPDAMLFHPTVYDEIAFGPRQFGLEDVDGRVRRWAEILGVAGRLDRPPFHLSGGEKQKVCLAAILAVDPEVLLLDEPTSHMDPRSTGWLVDFLGDWSGTTVTTTHNLSLAAELGDRTLVLGEDHGLIYDGKVGSLLEDKEKLLAANLMHAHDHRHGGISHRHYHTHDWD